METSQLDMESRLVRKTVRLLTSAPAEDRNSLMSEAANLLEDSGFAVGGLDRRSPQVWAEQLWSSLHRLVRAAEAQQYRPEGAESLEDLISVLLPSDHHLE